MGHILSKDQFNRFVAVLAEQYRIFAPVKLPGKGKFAGTDVIAYSEVPDGRTIVFDQKSYFSPKEIIFPINQTLFYFTEDGVQEPAIPDRDIVIFLHACDINAFHRLDRILLDNGPDPDPYYRQLRAKVKFILMDCQGGYTNCFCVSMQTNETADYNLYLRAAGEHFYCQGEAFQDILDRLGEPAEVQPRFVRENQLTVHVPENLDPAIFDHDLWKEYGQRCIACGRCNTSCPTCSCFTMQDVFYRDNPKCGERRRVWASCQIDGFTEMAGGHGFRKNQGERMRFKTMHKIYDFKKRFGMHMCVGCGRCNDVCPENISFAKCINRLNNLTMGVSTHE